MGKERNTLVQYSQLGTHHRLLVKFEIRLPADIAYRSCRAGNFAKFLRRTPAVKNGLSSVIDYDKLRSELRRYYNLMK